MATGDLRLIPSASLRRLIVRYLANVDVHTRRTLSNIDIWVENIDAFTDQYDFSEIILRTTPRPELDSLAQVEDFPPIPVGRLGRPFRFSTDDLLSDQVAYGHLEEMLNEKRNIAAHRSRIREASEALRADVEVALRDAGDTPSHACRSLPSARP